MSSERKPLPELSEERLATLAAILTAGMHAGKADSNNLDMLTAYGKMLGDLRTLYGKRPVVGEGAAQPPKQATAEVMKSQFEH